MKDIFDPKTTTDTIARIDQLTPETQPLWGKMNVSHMLAHCCVTYEMAYTDKHPAPKGFMKIILKLFVKNMVVSEKPYKKNLKTAPQFVIADERDFKKEKERLIAYIKKTEELGGDHFDGKENLSFGKMSKKEWNNMFYKHLDHHLQQFGV